MKQKLKSTGAVAAGLIANVVLAYAIDGILEATGVFPSYAEQRTNGMATWMLALALTYRVIIGAISGYITAALAPSKPQRHALVLAVIGTIGGIGGVIATWNLGPAWYSISLVALSLPAVLLGARLYRPRTTPAVGKNGPA